MAFVKTYTMFVLIVILISRHINNSNKSNMSIEKDLPRCALFVPEVSSTVNFSVAPG